MNISDFIVFQSSQVLQIQLGFIATEQKIQKHFLVTVTLFVVQGFFPRVLVLKVFCKLFNFFVADGRKPAGHAFILNNKLDASNLLNKRKRQEW